MELHEAFGGAQDVARLVIEEVDAPDELAHALEAQAQHRGRVGRGGEERGSRLVHALVRALRAEDRRDEQLVGRRVVERGAGVRELGEQAFDRLARPGANGFRHASLRRHQRTFFASAAKARPRWETRFFSSAGISAIVRPSTSRKTGS